MMNLGLKRKPNFQSGFTLIEVLVAAVIFVGVFLMLFTLLGRVLSNSSGSDQLRVAAIVELRLAKFHEGNDYSNSSELVELDGIRYRVVSSTETTELHKTLRLAIVRENANDTLGVFYGIRYVSEE